MTIQCTATSEAARGHPTTQLRGPTESTSDHLDVFSTVDRSGFPDLPPATQPWKQFPRESTEVAIRTGKVFVPLGAVMYGVGST